MHFPRSSLQAEHSRCDHQQPLNFFTVFADFRTLPEVSEK